MSLSYYVYHYASTLFVRCVRCHDIIMSEDVTSALGHHQGPQFCFSPCPQVSSRQPWCMIPDANKQCSSSNLKIFGLDNVDIHLIKSLNDQAHLIYDGIHLKWTQDLCLLKNFIKNIVSLKGLWISKQFISTNFYLNITWYPGKHNSLLFHAMTAKCSRNY